MCTTMLLFVIINILLLLFICFEGGNMNSFCATSFDFGNNTVFGKVSIHNIDLTLEDLDEYLLNICYQIDNLYYMFNEEDRTTENYTKFLKRFFPYELGNTISINDYVKNSMANNRSFYSFLAEGITSLILRDIYDLNLCMSAIDFSETLNDTRTGVDVCMYDENQNKIVIGESKFYSNMDNGIKAIIRDFTKPRGFLNKLMSATRKTNQNLSAKKIILQTVGSEETSDVTLSELLKNQLLFAGFVLHSSNTQDYSKIDYQKYISKISPLLINQNTNNITSLSNSINIEVVMLHLPIKDKKELIIKFIETARNLYITQKLGD